MNIVEEIQKLDKTFREFNKSEPNCVKLGKTEVCQLENWYNGLDKPEGNLKKVKVNDGAMIMGLCIIKIKKRSFIEVGYEDITKYTWKTVISNPYWEARVEVNK